jgi:hypothetical protein
LASDSTIITGQRPSFVTRANYDLLESLERDLVVLQDDMAAASECGVDCQVFRAMSAAYREQLAAIRQRFFTPPPQY